MAKSNNFPQAQIDDLEPDFVRETITSLRDLYERGKPETDEEVERRVDEYFLFCQERQNRPGIEGLCLALSVSRTTIFNWGHGVNCSKRRQEAINKAKMFINAFLEQSSLRGKISPPTAIFLMKNWMDYKDVVSFEAAAENVSACAPAVSMQELAELRKQHLIAPEKPEL